MLIKKRNHFFGFVFTEKTIIHKNTDKVIADGLMQQHCCHRRIHATAEGAKYFIISHLFFDFSNLAFHKGSHVPIGRTATDLKNKISENLQSVIGMGDFRMKLNAIQCLFGVCNSREGRIWALRYDFKVFWYLGYPITVTHPDGQTICHGNILKKVVLFFQGNLSATIF